MAFTRKMLKSMGLTEEQVDSVIEAHTEIVDSLKADVAKYRPDAEKLGKVQQELDDLKAKGDDGFEKKYNDEHAAFEKYKGEQEAKESKAAKAAAAKAYFESKNITGKNLDIALRGSSAEIAALEMEDGKIKDTAALDELVSGTFSGLVTTTRVSGNKTPNPHSNTGGTTMTKAEIAQIKDPAERRAAIAENMALFEKGE